VQRYEQAVQAQRDKVQLKTASILDMITLTDRSHDARLTAVSARANHAIALARFRFETGTILQPGATIESPLMVEDLTTLPPSPIPGAPPR
jgi:hypothetical protein